SQGAFDNETGRSTESLAGAFGEPPPRAGRPSEMVKVGASMPGNPADDSLGIADGRLSWNQEAIKKWWFSTFYDPLGPPSPQPGRHRRSWRSKGTMKPFQNGNLGYLATEARASPTPRRVLRNITPGGSPAAGRYRSQPDIAGSEDEHDDSRKRRGSPIRAITAAGAAGGKGSAPFVPVAGERPLGLDISAFAQRPKAELQTRTNPTSSWTAGGGAAPLSAGTQEELLEALSSGHYTMVGVLNQKLDTIRSVRAVWEESDPRLALERLRAANDSCVSADVLKVINSGGGRRGLNLDVVGVLCCIIREMLFEVFEDHITTACETLRLLLKAFGSVIASNLAPQPYAGVDISKEERCERLPFRDPFIQRG
ncbi:MAG: con80 domain of katanin-domain-containing protein, partial [Olpidium bornovanus]